MATSHPNVKNRLLAALPPHELRGLADEWRPVPLSRRQVIYPVGAPLDHLFFIEDGLASLLTTMEDGSSTEVAMVGKEGAVGAAALLGGQRSAQHIVMQLPGTALRVAATSCKALFERSPNFRRILLHFVEDLFDLAAQTAACNRLHTIEQRAARWLLMASTRVQSNVLALTQEFLAAMLGVRRSGISEAASQFQRAGVIRYRRGEITITDRDGLTAAACECSRLDRKRLNRLLP